MVIREFIAEAPPTRSVHAASIVETADGLLATWFGGLREGFRDVSIWTARRTEDGWSQASRVATGHWGRWRRFPCWNPVLFRSSNGPLSLYYKVGSSPSRWWGMVMHSEDDGVTWANPIRLPREIFGPIKNKPIELPDGCIVAPSSTEDFGWRIHVEATRDDGATWRRTEALNDGKTYEAIQPTILRHDDGQLLMLSRSRQGMIVGCRSTGDPLSWSAVEETNLPNPDSGIDAVTLDDGRFLLIYNHSSLGRSPLNLALSEDGETWMGAAVLENVSGEFSYPAIIQGANRRIHIVYTWNRRRIRYISLMPDDLACEPFQDGAFPETLNEMGVLGETE
jgi:predicted neuraminidase